MLTGSNLLIKTVRQVLGFIGYYRKFVKDFSKGARPLTDLRDLMPLTITRRGKGKKKKKNTCGRMVLI